MHSAHCTLSWWSKNICQGDATTLQSEYAVLDRMDKIDRIGRMDRIDRMERMDMIDRIDRIERMEIYAFRCSLDLCGPE